MSKVNLVSLDEKWFIWTVLRSKIAANSPSDLYSYDNLNDRYIGQRDPKTGRVKQPSKPHPSETTNYYAYLNRLPYSNCGLRIPIFTHVIFGYISIRTCYFPHLYQAKRE